MPQKTRKPARARRSSASAGGGSARAGAPRPAPGLSLGALSGSGGGGAVSSTPRPGFLLGLSIGAVVLLGLGLAFILFAGVGNAPGNQTPISGTPVASTQGRICFVRAGGGGSSGQAVTRDLFVVNADGTNQQQLTSGIIVQGTNQWSPDGRQIVMQATVDGVETIVRLSVGPDNKPGEAVQLTADVKADSALPAWSPDGSMIAFQSKREGGAYQVFVMDAGGNNKRRLSDGKGVAGQPAWSPDGKTIVYAAGAEDVAGAARELYTVPVTGGEPKRITELNSSLTRPIWSSDGQTISFIQVAGERDKRVMLVAPDGKNLRTAAQGLNSSQQFSPSGDRLAYYSTVAGEGTNIMVLALTDLKATSITPGPGDDYLPSWSPDGKMLAWASTTGGDQPHKIVSAPADGSGSRVTLSTGNGDDYQPAWALLK